MDHITVQVRQKIRARKWRIFRLLSRPQDYPAYISDVKQVLVFDRKGLEATLFWSIHLNELELSWTEAVQLDPRNYSIHFRAVSGDLEKFEGSWKLHSISAEETEVCLDLKLKIGIPMIETVLGPAISASIEGSFKRMLNAIADRLVADRYKSLGRGNSSGIKGFGVIGHPFSMDHLITYLRHLKPEFRGPSRKFLAQVFQMTPSYQASSIRGFRSRTGQLSDGIFIACTFVPEMLQSNLERVFEKVKQACKLAERLGIGIVTLGGFTSIAAEKYGHALSEFVNIPVTTGNTFTVAMVLEGVRKAAELSGIPLNQAHVTVIGGTGDIGGAVARILATQVQSLTLTGRNEKFLQESARSLSHEGRAKVTWSVKNNDAIRNADITIAAASAAGSVVDLKCFKPGAVICDVGYPKNISYADCDRDDILIFSGGMASIPSPFEVGFYMGLPAARVLYGCFSEAIILDLEGRYENFSYGRGYITKDKVDWIREAGLKHGFDLAPFFWGKRLLADEDFVRIRKIRESGSEKAHA